MGFGGMGFGGPGVRENKTVSASTEVRIPFKQFLGIWFVGTLISFFGYLVLKMFITDRGDWSLLIGLITPIALGAGAIYFDRRIAKRFFPNLWEEFRQWNIRVLDSDNFGPIILYFSIWAIIILLSVGFYLEVLVPQMTALFDQRAHFVFILCTFISLIVAARPYYIFNVRQLTDSLRDSDSRYAIRALELAHEDKWKTIERNDVLNSAPALPEPEEGLGVPILVRAPDKFLDPPNESDVRFKTAVMDFLNGIASGEWNTNERSWRNKDGMPKVLPHTGHRVMTVGKQIRDELIRAGWASWKNPDDKSAGWELNFGIDFIEHEAFNDENRIRTAPSGTSTASGEVVAGSYTVSLADDEPDDNGEGDFD